MSKYNCIVILGPTASGKTHLACNVADAFNGEIISVDSRQVYKYLNIGTGKDLHEYEVNGKKINYHLMDICEPGAQFYLHQFITEAEKAYEVIRSKNKLPIFCGGTGLYLDALRKDFSYTQIKENEELRTYLEKLSKEELLTRLKKFPVDSIKHVDEDSKKRIIRAIEVATFLQAHLTEIKTKEIPYHPYYIGIKIDLEERKKKISERLIYRVNNGLIEEAESLLNTGISHERLQFLGLEYKFVSLFLQNKIAKKELIEKLQTAIFQFAKRQMTWFRKMEKEGVKINWVQKSDLENGSLIKLLQAAFE